MTQPTTTIEGNRYGSQHLGPRMIPGQVQDRDQASTVKQGDPFGRPANARH